MSRYVSFDHGAWVQSQLTGSKKRTPTKVQARKAADKTGWHGGPDELNDFHRRAFDILGITGGGIYNCPISWKSVRWCSPRQIIVPWLAKGFGTWDFNELTLFTFLCHAARIRGYIAPCSPTYLHVWLSERTDTGDISRRHPNLDQAVADFQSWYTHSHSITFAGDRADPPVMERVRAAVQGYHGALDKRMHGDVAAHACLDRIQAALQMPWVQGATLCPPVKESADAGS